MFERNSIDDKSWISSQGFDNVAWLRDNLRITDGHASTNKLARLKEKDEQPIKRKAC